MTKPILTGYEQIINHIDRHIKQCITVEGIAHALGYSPSHIHKLFKAYSPYPVMEYARRKRLFYAVCDMYSGRKLYDIALDYGYDTPAGFYKAFKSVFGCSPSAYKNNLWKAGSSMNIDYVRTVTELDRALAFTKALYPNHPVVNAQDGEKYSRSFWIQEWEKHPTLLLFAHENGQVCGVILGWADGNFVTVFADGVLPGFENKGIHEALFIEMEKRAKALGFKGLVLGIGDGKEAFYATMGYMGKTLVQSEKHGVDALKAFNAAHFGYEVTGSGVYDGYVNQLWLNVPLTDKGPKRKYTEELGDCWVQVIVSKMF